MAYFSVATEGTDDEAAAKRLLLVCGHGVSTSFILDGKGNLDPKIPGYNNAAQGSYWFVLRDLDADAECGPELVNSLLPHRQQQMILRVPVRALEAWLLSDRESIAEFLSVSPKHLPRDPSLELDPKVALVNVARRSRRSVIREEMVPPAGYSTKVGPGYTGMLIEFIGSHWDPRRAATNDESLRRCIDALDAIASYG